MRSRKEEKRGRRKIRWMRLFVILFILVVGFTASIGAGVYAYLNLFHTAAAPGGAASGKTSDTLSSRINILLLGVDDAVDSPDAPKRSDTIIVASIDPKDGKINLLSIPRDTKVSIPGRKGYDKINSAYAYGGADLAERTVEQFLNISINYYVVMNWQGFMKAVDILGGVDLYVEKDMNYEDPYANLSIHLTKGFQHLDGTKAGEYVRFRHDELGDIGRVQRQQRFLTSLSDEMFKFGTIFKLPALTSVLRQYISTNMPPMTMLKFANTVKGFTESGLHTELLPGKFATIDGLSYWVPDKDQSRQMVESMFFTTSTKTTGTVSGKTKSN